MIYKLNYFPHLLPFQLYSVFHMVFFKSSFYNLHMMCSVCILCGVVGYVYYVNNGGLGDFFISSKILLIIKYLSKVEPHIMHPRKLY